MTRLDRQARGAPVATLKDVPILIATGEDECEEDNKSIRWVHRASHLSNMMALRAIAMRLTLVSNEKLRYGYEKIKAKGKVRTMPMRYAPKSRS